MPLTRLEIVNAVLRSIREKEVSSSDFQNDRPQEIWKLVKEVYNDIHSAKQVPLTRSYVTLLQPSLPEAMPTTLSQFAKVDSAILPDPIGVHVTNIYSLEYNSGDDLSQLTSSNYNSEEPVWNKLEYLSPEDFADVTDNYSGSECTLNRMDNGIAFLAKKEKIPQYFTHARLTPGSEEVSDSDGPGGPTGTFRDIDNLDFIILDSFEQSKGLTTNAVKHINPNLVRAYVEYIPLLEDSSTSEAYSFYIPIDPRYESYFVRECQAVAHALENDGVNPKLESLSRRLRIYNQKNRSFFDKESRTNYGRR